MIASLRGQLLARGPGGEVVIEVAGVGYRATVTAATEQRLGSVGAEAFLWIHHHFREDHQALFGFTGREERDCFEALIGAHGVGPALALAILSVHSPKELVRILAEDDLTALCLVPGVGKKTAARLVVELKTRLDVGSFEASSASVGGLTGPIVGASPRAVVRQALAELGYGPEEIRRALDDIDEAEDADEATLLRAALRRVAR
ncbi:MAG: holliday junction helicase RuvA [Acidimicrobiia bacterium]|jgi:Holliday junction DNA helicase RuvA|nr:holliday junction helicase RuvA [Acidimicrobiia bacterium]